MRLKIGKTSLIIDYYFIAVLTLMLVVFRNESILRCFLFCVLHEVGHLTAMFIFGERVRSVHLGYFGMKIDCGDRILPAGRETVIALAGPAVNLILAAMFLLFGFNADFSVNIALAVFNLLPVKMLDGGRILALFLSPRAMRAVGIAAGVLMSLLGAAVAIYTKSNYIILIVSLYILIGAVK